MQNSSNNKNKLNKHLSKNKDRECFDKNNKHCKTEVQLSIFRFTIDWVWTYWCFLIFYGAAHSGWHTTRKCVLICSTDGIEVREKYEKEKQEHWGS